VVLCDPRWQRAGGDLSLGDDLRALGAILYRLLTGRGSEPGEGGLPVPPSKLNPAVPIDLDRAVLKLLHPDPSRRYRSASNLVQDLRRLCEPRPPSALGPPECFLDRKEELSRALSVLSGGKRPAALAVSGEAGMGKSSFLRRLALEAELDGYRTASVRCFTENAAPLAPVRSLLSEVLPPDRAGRALRARCRVVLHSPEKSAAFDSPEDVGRRRLAREALNLLVEASADRPILLLVDEVHRADSLTVQVLAELAKEIALSAAGNAKAAGAQLSLCVSFRTESPFRAALRPLLDAFDAPSETRRAIELVPLPERVVSEWLGLAMADGSAPVASQLHGHPFLIQEFLRTGRAPEAGAAPGGGLDAAHVAYLRSLDPYRRRIIECLAVLARPA
ncbi:MAG: AAA family ATPase, partial [Thermoanaerobaculia bacterium]